MTILITTAGKVGREAARLLAGQDQPVRILVHTHEKVAAFGNLDVEAVHADLEVPAAVDTAMRDVTSVVLVTAPVVTQEINREPRVAVPGHHQSADGDLPRPEVPR